MLHPDIFGEITEKIVPGKHVIDIIDYEAREHIKIICLVQPNSKLLDSLRREVMSL